MQQAGRRSFVGRKICVSAAPPRPTPQKLQGNLFCMASSTAEVLATYVRAWTEPDAAVRERLVEQCFAVDGRFVMSTREIRGRAQLLALMARVHADPNLLRIRVLGLDVRDKTFRLLAAADLRDGTSPETLDAGELDADGRIRLVLTFTGPFPAVVATD